MTAQPIKSKRKEPPYRKRVLLRAIVYAPTGAHSVRIRDISNNGAQVASDDPLPPGCDLIFKHGPIFAAAQVAWVKGNMAGLQFYRPVDDTDLLRATASVGDIG